jgi:hypothetical protein
MTGEMELFNSIHGMTMHRLFYLLAYLSIASCIDSTTGSTAEIEDIEGSISIPQGIYGQVLSVNDVGTGDSRALEGFDVKIFLQAPNPEATPPDVPLIETETNVIGFFEIPLQSGDYCICTAFFRCSSFSLEVDAITRIDYTFGNHPGWHLSELTCE